MFFAYRRYHGRFGFEEFSHKRSVLYRTTLLPLTILPDVIKAGRVPAWLADVALKMGVTGFVPAWLKQLATFAAAATAAIAAAIVAQHLAA